MTEKEARGGDNGRGGNDGEGDNKPTTEEEEEAKKETTIEEEEEVAAEEEAKGGDRILLAGYGNGCDVFSLKVRDEIENIRGKRGIKGYLSPKRMISGYNKYLRWRELVTVQTPPRPPLEFRQPSPSAQWRENQGELRLRGTRCLNCGTPQYPPQRVCMSCKTTAKFEPYSFMD